MDNLPVIPKDLLEALEKQFPERCPDIGWSDREIWVRVGERRLVRFLRRVYDQQNENILRQPNVHGT